MANRTQQSNPNPRDQRARDLPGPRATAVAGACDALAPPLAGLRGTVEPPARCSGTPGSRVRGSKAWLRPRPARRRRAHPLASARAGEQAATVPSRSLPQATMASGRRRRVLWREKGEERMTLGFGARRRRRGFVLAKTADDRPIVINGRESASPSGPASGPCGRGRGRRGGPIRRPGRWLSGLGPMRRWLSGPWAVFHLWAAQ